jgi:hypothetical protein
MANVMRWRYGDTNPVMLAVDSATVIEIGDLIYLDTDDAKPASALSYGASLAATQETFHDSFVGVAMQASASGDTSEIRVATGGVFEFDCASASFEVGGRIGVDDNVAEDELIDQQVVAVSASSPELAIAKVAKRATSTTRVLVQINSTVMNDGPQAVATS